MSKSRINCHLRSVQITTGVAGVVTGVLTGALLAGVVLSTGALTAGAPPPTGVSPIGCKHLTFVKGKYAAAFEIEDYR